MTTPKTSGNEGQHSGGGVASDADLDLLLRRAIETADIVGSGEKIGPLVGAYAAICLRAMHGQIVAMRSALGTAPGSVGEGDVSARNQPCADVQGRSHDNHSFDGKEG